MTDLPHRRTTELMSHLAQAHDVCVTEDDQRFWAASFSVAKALDTLIDEYHVPDIAPYVEQILHEKPVPGLNAEELQLFTEVKDSLTPEQEVAFDTAVSQIGIFAVRRATCETVEQYIETIFDESYLMSGILKVAVHPENPDKPHRKRFNTWLDQFGRTAYAWDSLADIVRDRNEHNVNIPLNPHTLRTLGGAAVHEAHILIGASPLGIYPPILYRGLSKVGEKIQQRNFFTHQFVPRRNHLLMRRPR